MFVIDPYGNNLFLHAKRFNVIGGKHPSIDTLVYRIRHSWTLRLNKNGNLLLVFPGLSGKKERDRTGNCRVERIELAKLWQTEQVVAFFTYQVT